MTDGWREKAALAFDDKVGDSDQALGEIDNLVDMYADEGDEKSAAEARAFAALVRSKRRDYETHARQLRSEPPAAVVPMTSRFPR